MRKDEMSQEQLRERELIVTKLTNAGWDNTAFNRLFDKGKNVKAEARMTFRNPQRVELSVTYYASYGLLYFGMRDEDGLGISIASRPHNRIEEWLDIVVSGQQNVSKDNYRTCIQSILDAFPDTRQEIEREGELVLVPLS